MQKIVLFQQYLRQITKETINFTLSVICYLFCLKKNQQIFMILLSHEVWKDKMNLASFSLTLYLIITHTNCVSQLLREIS